MCEVIQLPPYRLRETKYYNRPCDVVRMVDFLTKKYSKPQVKPQHDVPPPPSMEQQLQRQMELNKKKQERIRQEQIENTNDVVGRLWTQPIA